MEERMTYRLSDENNKKKEEYEKRMQTFEEQWKALQGEISRVRASKEGTFQQREIRRLELEVQQDEIGQKIDLLEGSIKLLYANECKAEIIRRGRAKELSTLDGYTDRKKCEGYSSMRKSLDMIDYDTETMRILKKKRQIWYKKIDSRQATDEDARKPLEEIEQQIQESKESVENERQELAKSYFNYRHMRLSAQVLFGNLDVNAQSAIRQKMSELEGEKSETPSIDVVEGLLKELCEKYLEVKDYNDKLQKAYKGAEIKTSDIGSASGRLETSRKGENQPPNRMENR